MSKSEREHLSFSLGEPNYFGDCPRCGGDWICLNVGRSHWASCKRDQVRWWLGSNLFSSWRHETEEQWDRNAETLQRFEEVEPWVRHRELWRRDVPVGLRLRNLACSHTHRAIREYCINVFRHRIYQRARNQALWLLSPRRRQTHSWDDCTAPGAASEIPF